METLRTLSLTETREPEIAQENISQVSEEIEGRVTKKTVKRFQ